MNMFEPTHRFNEFNPRELVILGAALHYYQKRIADGNFGDDQDRDETIAKLKSQVFYATDDVPCRCLGCSIKRTELEED